MVTDGTNQGAIKAMEVIIIMTCRASYDIIKAV